MRAHGDISHFHGKLTPGIPCVSFHTTTDAFFRVFLLIQEFMLKIITLKSLQKRVLTLFFCDKFFLLKVKKIIIHERGLVQIFF